MATHNLAHGMADQAPIIPDEDLERLLAEMFGRRRSAPRAVQAPAPAPVAPSAPPVQVAPEPTAFASFEAPALEPELRAAETGADEAGPAVEPLHLPRRRRKGRWMMVAMLSVLAVGAGWWASGMQPAFEISSLLQRASLLSAPQPSALRAPPIIAAPPPNAVRAAPPDTEVATPSSGTPASAPPTPAQPQSQAAAPLAQPPADGAGVLGKPEIGPFDQVTPRSVRTTAVLPPRSEADAANVAPKPLDFDDPSTWPAGAEKADPHPLPPRRR